MWNYLLDNLTSAGSSIDNFSASLVNSSFLFASSSMMPERIHPLGGDFDF